MPFLPDLIVRSRRVVTPGSTRAASVHIRGGKIVGVLPFDDVPPGCPLDEAGEAAVIPGIVDTNVHVSEPGPSGWEGFESTTRAAAAGGVTTLIDMPRNSLTVTTSAQAIEAKRAAAEGRCHVDVGFWGALSPGSEHDLGQMREAGVFGFMCWLATSAAGHCPPVSEADLRVAMPAIARLGLPLLVHAELPGPIDAAAHRRPGDRFLKRFLPGARRARRRYGSFLDSRPKALENDGIGLMIALCRASRTPVHIVDLSSSDALSPLFHARSAHLPITVETCPHYLSFVAEEIADGATAFKCAPPIRERENREFLWAALAGGLIQMVVSDHSPAPRDVKASARSGDFTRAWSGISSVQLSLSATWTEAVARGYTLSQLTNWMCRMPARLAALSRKGSIEPGYEADLVIFDPDAQFTVDAATLQSGQAPTPYLGRRLRGVVERTYLAGQRIYGRGRATERALGRLLTRVY